MREKKGCPVYNFNKYCNKFLSEKMQKKEEKDKSREEAKSRIREKKKSFDDFVKQQQKEES